MLGFLLPLDIASGVEEWLQPQDYVLSIEYRGGGTVNYDIVGSRLPYFSVSSTTGKCRTKPWGHQTTVSCRVRSCVCVWSNYLQLEDLNGITFISTAITDLLPPPPKQMWSSLGSMTHHILTLEIPMLTI